MKVLFFEPYTLAIPHYETALELIQNHLDEGDQVRFYYCDANLYFCEANYTHNLSVCTDCISRRKNGLKLINGRYKIAENVFEALSKEEKKIIENWDVKFNTVEEIKQFHFEGIDLGMAVASSLISSLRESYPDTILQREFINKIFRSALKVYFSFKKTLLIQKPDVVYFFNGRFANLRVVLRLCEMYKINYRIHERGSNRNKYSLYDNHLPHDVKAIIKLIKSAWEKETDTIKRNEIANSYYLKRKSGVQQSWFSFVGNQKMDMLPSNWDGSKRNIVIFNSSEDEFAAIGSDFVNLVFPNQLESVKYVVDALKDRNDVAIYLRMHPNLKDVADSSTTALYELKSPNFMLIPPDSNISTYKLIDECNVVLSFGSTTGVEATFWDKPSVLVGNTFYKSLDVTYNAETKEEVIDFLLNANEPKEKVGALMYAHYLATFGIDFKHYSAKELFDGEFKGVRIQPTILISKRIRNKIIAMVKKHRNRLFNK